MNTVWPPLSVTSIRHVVQVVKRQVAPSPPQFPGHLAGFGLRVLKSKQV